MKRRTDTAVKSAYWTERIQRAIARGAATVQKDEKGVRILFNGRVFPVMEQPVELAKAEEAS